MFTDESAQMGVTEARLVEKAADFLHPRRYEERDDARAAARTFIEFCRGRAWVFTDIGTAPSDERLYHFTHRTFLEYFTAIRLVSTATTQDRLIDILLPHIEVREWDVVAQLAFQIMGRQVNDAGDTLLTSLLARAQQAQDSGGWNALSFAVRCLQFLTPSLSVIHSLARTAIERCMARSADDLRVRTYAANADTTTELSVVRMLHALKEASAENRNPTMSAIEPVLAGALCSHDENIVMAAYEVCLLTGHATLAFLDFSSNSDDDALDEWRAWSQVILVSAPLDRVKAVAMHSLLICHDAYWRGLIEMRDYLAWHGAGAIFREARYTIRELHTTCTAVDILTSVLALTDTRLAQDRADTLTRLDDVGATLASWPRPWLEEQDVAALEQDIFLFQQPDDPWPQEGQQHLVADQVAQPDRRFGLFALLATLSEVEPATIGWLIDIMDTVIRPSGELVRARYQQRSSTEVDDQLVDDLLRECAWSAEQRALAWLWIHDEESFSAARERDMESNIDRNFGK